MKFTLIRLYARALVRLPVELAKGAVISAVVFVCGAVVVVPVALAVTFASKVFNVNPQTLMDALTVLGALGWLTHVNVSPMKNEAEVQPVRIDR
jgi:hypothetical protein